jgi:NAD(P)-dependent dehydrogenase (short-subunit alcohol dehydrogenase family)
MEKHNESMVGKTCVVTGASSGIGKEISFGLAEKGARVVMVARDAGRGEAARTEVGDRTGNDQVELVLCDLSSQRQVRELASTLLRRCDTINVLVNNAGLTLGDYLLTEDDIETTFAVNHLAPFLLTNLLLERLQASAPARVVTVASDAHRGNVIDFEDVSASRAYSSWKAYGASKLANILFTGELARRLDGTGVTATCLHPGVVRTGFGRRGPSFIRWWFKLAGSFLLTPAQGADTAVWLASSPEVEGASGGYYEKRKLRQPSKAAGDRKSAARLWDVSRRLTGLRPG